MIDQVTDKKHAFKHNIIELLLGMLCTFKIIYGLDHFLKTPGIIIVNVFIVLVIGSGFHYFVAKL